ncbi:putative short-chain dehydrogenase [Poronia punctata]|nr:putative short-chain dehydrogenase [Poronia punctata]
MSQPLWFITGVSNGFGHILTLRALRAGHRVVGTVRSKTRYPESISQIEEAGGQIIEMDMTESQESIKQKVKSVGPIDYLVNNAGYSIFCCLEQITEKEMTQQITTNVFGAVYVMQGALEGGMRERRSGLIINISSIAAKDPLPTNALYAASKAALEAISESLQKEVADLGVSILIVNPGSFRTNFLSDMQFSANPLPEEYKSGAVGQMMGKFSTSHGKQPGDPEKAVERIFEIVNGGEGLAAGLKGKVSRLVLGEDAFVRMRGTYERLGNDLELGERVALSTGFE